MGIPWTLRLITGVVARGKDTVTHETVAYGGSNQAIATSTRHAMTLWVDTDDGQVVSANLDNTQTVTATSGDRVRIVFADPGAHVVGMANETLGQTWHWKFPSPGSAPLIAALALLILAAAAVGFLLNGNIAVALLLSAIVAYIVIVPLGRNRQSIRALQEERSRMLAMR